MARLILVNGRIYSETGTRTVLVNGSIFNATVSAGGGVDVLTADDLRSASQVSSPVLYDLAADDLRSSSQLSSPATGQEHALLADDLRSAPQLSKPTASTIGQDVLTADDLRSASQISSPALALNPPQFAYSGLDPQLRWTAPGSVGNVTGVLDIRVHLRPQLWDNNTSQIFISKYDNSPIQKSWLFYVDATRNLRYYQAVGGDQSTAVVPFADGEAGWCRVHYDWTVNELKFYTSTDGEIWTQNGSTITSVTAQPTASTALVEVSSFNTGQFPTRSGIYRAQVFEDDVLVVDFNPNEAAVGDNQTWDAVLTGETWTAAVGAPIVKGHALWTSYVWPQSSSQISTPASGQEHALTADDLRSGTELSTPALGQEHALLADDLRSGTELSTPALGQEHALLADDLRSGSELSTPTAAHVHTLTADDLQSGTELSTPAIGQEQVLTADDIESVSRVGGYGPEMVVNGTFDTDSDWDTTSVNFTTDTGVALTSPTFQPEGNLLTPNVIPSLSLAPHQYLLSFDLEVLDALPAPFTRGLSIIAWGIPLGTLIEDEGTHSFAYEFENSGVSETFSFNGQENFVGTLDNISIREIQPYIGQTHVLLADDLRSGSQISTPALGQANVLLADDLRSGSELSTPTAGHIHDLAADDLQSGTQVSSPALAHIHVLLADDLQSGPQLSSPLTGDYFQRMVPDGALTVGSWTNELGSTVNMHLSIDEIPDPDESDWVQSKINPSLYDGGPIFTLSDVVPTPLADADQTLKVRVALEENTTEPFTLYINLLEGSNPRVLLTELVSTDVPYTITHVLTQAEKDSIVDYNNLTLSINGRII